MQVGEISDVVKTKFGFHVIKLTEKENSRIKELAEVREAVEQSLRRLKKKMLFNKFVERLKERSQITINDNLLLSVSNELEKEKNPAN